MSDAEKSTKYSVVFSPEENTALEIVQKMPQFNGVVVSKRAAMRVAILGFQKMDVYGDILRELIGLRTDISNFKNDTGMQVVSKSSSSSRGPGRPTTPKPTEDQKHEHAKQICSALGGTIDGDMCMYKKRELTAIGKAAEYEVGVGLDALTQENIDTQYYPSRDEWEDINRKYNS